MDDLYRSLLFDHIKHPRGRGVLEPCDAVGHAANASCGDEIDVYVRLHEDGRIEQYAWTGKGCAVSQALASMIAEVAVGCAIRDLATLTLEDIAVRFGMRIGPMRERCALLAVAGVRALHPYGNS